jgi:hypothetical protein
MGDRRQLDEKGRSGNLGVRRTARVANKCPVNSRLGEEPITLGRSDRIGRRDVHRSPPFGFAFYVKPSIRASSRLAAAPVSLRRPYSRPHNLLSTLPVR